MKRISLNVRDESQPEWLDIPPDLRGHHRALIVLCARLENSGVLRGLRCWSEMRLGGLAGLKTRTIQRLVAHGLVAWEGDDLRVNSYNVGEEEHATLIAKINTARAKKRWATELESVTSDLSLCVKSAQPLDSGYAGRIAARNASDPIRSDPDLKGPTGHPPTTRPPLRVGGLGEGEKRVVVGSASPVSEAEAEPEGFGKFWNTYPKIRTAWRDKAIDVWQRLQLEPDTDRILAHVAKMRKTRSWRTDDGYFVPTPWAFLESRDWPSPAPAAPPVKPAVKLPAGKTIIDEWTEKFPGKAFPGIFEAGRLLSEGRGN